MLELWVEYPRAMHARAMFNCLVFICGLTSRVLACMHCLLESALDASPQIFLCTVCLGSRVEVKSSERWLNMRTRINFTHVFYMS